MNGRLRYSVRTLWILITLVCLYLGMWSVTARWGVEDVTEWMAAQAEPGSIRWTVEPNEFTNPMPASWHFVNNASAPCPFIVGADWGWARHSTDTGERSVTGGGRSYMFWFFGWKVRLPFLDEVHWMGG